MALAEAPVEVAAGTVHVPASELRRALALVEHATGSEDDRPILSAVLLSARNGHLYAVASDNYRIAEAHIEVTGDASFLGDVTTLLPASDRPAVMAWLKSVGKYAEVDITLDNRSLVLSYGRRQITVTLMDGTFPPYWSVLGGDVLPPVVFAINPAYLADAGKALTGETTLQVRAEGPLAAVHFRRDGYREVVMPIRTAE